MKKFFIVFLIFSFFLTAGGGCQLVSDPAQDPSRPVTLEYWRVFDGEDAFEEIIEQYNLRHPHVNINYRKIRYEDYREELLTALAEDRGPDIFSIHNTWVREYINRIEPMPETVTISRLVEEGTIKTETVQRTQTERTMSLRQLENTFLDVVYDDVVLRNDQGEEKIYSLPLSVDTLAMYFNRDLLNNAGISTPPEKWDRDFQNAVKEMTKQDSRGNISQAGVGMGGSDNIERSVDILSLLMMQNGTEMMTENGNVLFDASGSGTQGYNPGMEALRFYTDFANPAKEVYCWNDNLDNSLKMFTEGRLALMFGYSYHLPEIKSMAPTLNFNVTNVPQINPSRQINHANYWTEVVSRKSENKDVAWHFLMFATGEDQAQKYLEKTNKPTALRSLVEEQKEDREIGVFAEQLLTSKSWYRGKDALAMEEVMKDMIDEAKASPQELDRVISRGSSRVQQTAR